MKNTGFILLDALIALFLSLLFFAISFTAARELYLQALALNAAQLQEAQ